MKAQQIKILNLGLVPDGTYEINSKHVIVTGQNQTGKSTFTQIIGLIADKKLGKFAKRGTSHSHLEYTCDDGTILKWNSIEGEESIVLVVDGKRKTNPTQKMIKEIIGENFDIDKFINKSPAERKKEVLRFSGVDADDIVKKIKAKEGIRKEAKKELAFISNKLNSVDEIDIFAEKPTEIKVDDLITERNYWQDHQKLYTDKNYQIEKSENYLLTNIELQKSTREKIELLQKELSELEAKEVILTNENKRLIQEQKDIGDKSEQINYLQNKIDSASEQNKKFQAWETTESLYKEVEEKQKEVDDSELAVKLARNELADEIENADLPDGISLSDDLDSIVIIDKNGNEVDIDNINTAAKIITALQIGRKYLGQLQTMSVDMSSLDSRNRQKIFDWANSNGLQLFAEAFNDSETMEVEYKDVTH